MNKQDKLNDELKKQLYEYDSLCEMANINPVKSGLKAIIWSDGGGIARKKKDNDKRAKVGPNAKRMYSVTLTKDCHIFDNQIEEFNKEKSSDKKAMEQAMKYISDNLDVFLKHYNCTDGSFDDEDLFNALRERGCYK